MKKIRSWIILATLFVTVMVVTTACRKSGMQSDQIAEGPTLEQKFFDSHRSADPIENALVEFVKRSNNKTPFIEKTVEKIGYPRWDKVIKLSNTTAARAPTTFGIGKSNTRNGSTVYDTYYVPFVRGSQNHVNAAMAIRISPKDTLIKYLCDWQYKKMGTQVGNAKEKAENFAIFFMVLDKSVFGHTKFRITDRSLFKKDKGVATMVELKSRPGNPDVSLNLEYVENCQDVTITFTRCQFIAIDGMCFVPGSTTDRSPTCDHCGIQACPVDDLYLSYQYCWGQWVDDGGDGGSGSGSGSGGDEGSGGSGGGSTPPDPCEGTGGGGPTPESVGSNPNNGPRVNVSACDPNPGWEPEPTPPGPPCPITKEDLKLAFPLAAESRLQEIANTINTYGPKFGLDTKEKISYFLGQAAAETGPGFTDLYKTEYDELNRMTVANLLANFTRFFSLTDPNKKNPNDYVHNPEKLANLVYGPETDLGNTQVGDGYKYIGRGFLMTTGRENYTKYKEFYNKNFSPPIDPVGNPDILISDAKNSIVSALFYFKNRVLKYIPINANTNIDKVSAKVYAGKLSLKDRRNYTTAGLAHINCH